MNITIAREIASQAHHHQKYGIYDYFSHHILGVGEIIQTIYSQDEALNDLLIIGMLHDVVEDTPITLDHLRQQGFSCSIVNAVEAITFNKAQETRATYYQRLKQNELARKVKIADAMFNAKSSEQDPKRFAYYQNIIQTLS